MPLYENTLITRPDISSQQVDGLSEQFQEIVRNNGGEVSQTEYWGLKSLAYRIKKNRKGHYTMMSLDAPSDIVKEFERNMRLNEDVLRLMTIRLDELSDEPSVMMKNKHTRDERTQQQDQNEEVMIEVAPPELSDQSEASIDLENKKEIAGEDK